VSLEEDIASGIVENLLESAEVRERAELIKDRHASENLLSRASKMEARAAQWEERLRWWRHLRRHDSA